MPCRGPTRPIRDFASGRRSRPRTAGYSSAATSKTPRTRSGRARSGSPWGTRWRPAPVYSVASRWRRAARDRRRPAQHPESTETQNKTDIAKNAETNDWIGAPETFPTTKWQTLTVKKGDTLSHIFKRAGLSARDVHRFVISSKDAKALTNLRPGEQILFDIQDKKLLQLKREINNIESTLFVWQDNDNTFSAEHHKKQLRPFTTYTQGTIDS